MAGNSIGRLGATLILAAAYATSAQAADYSVGGMLGTQGVGVTAAKRTDWSLVDEDQLQLRFTFGGLDVDDVDDLELSGTKYKADYRTGTLTGGVDWYPFSGKYVDNIFFSGGLVYFDHDIKGTTKSGQSFNVGGAHVSSSDNVRLDAEVDQSSWAPYLSLGWGNRIRSESGFSFQAELGVMTPLSDPDVKLSARDPGGVLSADNLERERRDIEDDLGGAQGFLSVAVTYQF
ncbi:hypothetical protein O5O45_29975 [Hahella aquimaris]|uniref:hypothetical protein n=1 Tax=Hahella sp. HNIBRBA332 TaxID=3015983 RepID=UPI00273B633A|nr:hypothetical protein [Hahella sp. HNIBRBA332]WLQ13956.1 hypothetical protein O5O45_29975 [Hahella sp. HNIBRBA332]